MTGPDPAGSPRSSQPLTDVVDELERDVRRVAGRLRSMPAGRFDAGREQVRGVLQQLADTARLIESGRADPDDATRRTVPELADHALGDQLEVLGTDLVVAAHDLTRVVDGIGDDDLRADAVRRAADALVGLRRAL